MRMRAAYARTTCINRLHGDAITRHVGTARYRHDRHGLAAVYHGQRHAAGNRRWHDLLDDQLGLGLSVSDADRATRIERCSDRWPRAAAHRRSSADATRDHEHPRAAYDDQRQRPVAALNGLVLHATKSRAFGGALEEQYGDRAGTFGNRSLAA